MAPETATPAESRDQSDAPTERANLQIRTVPFSIDVSAQGTAACRMALGVIGPAVTIAVGHFAGFPVWAVILVVVLQIFAALQRRRE
jgi:glycerol uptake facilitator-like aquaporin